ncbi:haloacid dehalogenase type II [Aquimarina addita]|uniref:Haloacid dehalogenase type II n=1 Tax=Aquimarina addita TaxID=870485 RepID=A0ABP6UN02_9FLAO
MTIKACVFDAFGTLFQLALPSTLINDDRAINALNICRQKQLEYSWLYSQMGAYIPFEEVTKKALAYAYAKLQITDSKFKEQLQTIFLTPNYYDDVLETLKELQQNDITCGILSNGSPKMLEGVLDYTGLQNTFDFVLSADTVKTFKPNPKVYQLVVDHLGLIKKELLFVSSNQWDIAGANNFEFKTAWINRQNITKEPIIEHTNHRELKSVIDVLRIVCD